MQSFYKVCLRCILHQEREAKGISYHCCDGGETYFGIARGLKKGIGSLP